MLTTRIADSERTEFQILKKDLTVDPQFQHTAVGIS